MTTVSNNGPYSNADGRGGYSTGEETLRLIAGLPAPEGIEDRIKAGLRTAPGTGRILQWRGPFRPADGWMFNPLARLAAAAAIVCVVAGGGWRIYSHVQPSPDANVIVMPSPGMAPAAPFTSSGARRVPDTLQGPVLKNPVSPPTEVKAVEKALTRPNVIPARKGKKSPARPSASPVQ